MASLVTEATTLATTLETNAASVGVAILGVSAVIGLVYLIRSLIKRP